MSRGQIPKATSVILCDICGNEIADSTYHGGVDHRGQVTRETNDLTPAGHGTLTGSLLFGWIARTVSNRTRHAQLTWPPPSWDRTKPFNERPRKKTYDFHGECILRLVEGAKANLDSAPRAVE